MTSRERFRQTMRYGRPDRVPLLDEGMREDVLERWHEQGLPQETDLGAMFQYDRRQTIELQLDPRPELKRVPTTRRDLATLKERLDPDDPARLPADWPDRVQRWRLRDDLLELQLRNGLFRTMGVGDWAGLEEVLYLLADCPSFVRNVMEMHGQFTARLVERVLRDVDIDFVAFSEPIGGNHGPLVSPRTYREIVLPAYTPVIDVLKSHGVETIVFVTFANARSLLPDVVAAGFNCLWAVETESRAMDYLSIRRQFGRSLRLIGGIDLDCLMGDEEAIEREILSKVPPLLAEGGYIPLADGRVRATMSFEKYAFYRQTLERLAGAV